MRMGQRERGADAIDPFLRRTPGRWGRRPTFPVAHAFKASMKRRVVVTGLGAVTSLSCQIEDLWKRILQGESGIHAIRLFDTSGFKVRFGGDLYDWSTGDYISAKD